MQFRRRSNNPGSCRTGRNGFLYVGALREILVVGLLGTVAFALMCQTNAIIRQHYSAKKKETLCNHSEPVLAIALDRDRQSLLVQTWGKKVEEVSLDGCRVSNKATPLDFRSIEISETGSTTITLTEWGDGVLWYHGVEITRLDDVLLYEEISTRDHSTADVHISMDGSLAMFISHAGRVVVWDLTSIEPTRCEYKLGQFVYTNRLSPDGRSLLIVSEERDVLIFDVRTGALRVASAKIDERASCAAWSRDNRRFAVADHGGMISLFDTESGEQLWKLKNETLFTRVMALSADGNRLIVGGFDREIRIWDWTSSPESPLVLNGNTALVRNIILADSDTKLICGCLDGTIREWSLETQKMTRQIR